MLIRIHNNKRTHAPKIRNNNKSWRRRREKKLYVEKSENEKFALDLLMPCYWAFNKYFWGLRKSATVVIYIFFFSSSTLLLIMINFTCANLFFFFFYSTLKLCTQRKKKCKYYFIYIITRETGIFVLFDLFFAPADNKF